MGEFAAFMDWARKDWGLTISDGIALGRRDGGKIGIFAQRDIEAGETIIMAPESAIISTDAIVSAYIEDNAKLPTSSPSTHSSNALPFPLHVSTRAMLAWYLTVINDKPLLAPWRATWPTEEEFKILPARWREGWRRLLAYETREIVEEERCRLEKSWKVLRPWICNQTNDANNKGKGTKLSNGTHVDIDKIKASFEYRWSFVSTHSFLNLYASPMSGLRIRFKDEYHGKRRGSDNVSSGKKKDSNDDDEKGKKETKGNRRQAATVGFNGKDDERKVDEASQGSDADLDDDDGCDPDDKTVAHDLNGNRFATEEVLVLIPLLDHFNRAGEKSAKIKFNDPGSVVVTTRPHKSGEEIILEANSLGNDYLLGRFGFILPEHATDYYNPGSHIPIDSAAQVKALLSTKYYGRWQLNPQRPFLCQRTHAVLHLLSKSNSSRNGDDDDPPPSTNADDAEHSKKRQEYYESILGVEYPLPPSSRAAVVALAHKVLIGCKGRVGTVLRALGLEPRPWETDDGPSSAAVAEARALREHVVAGMMRERWKQIGRMVEAALSVWLEVNSASGDGNGNVIDVKRDGDPAINAVYKILFEG